MDTGKDSRFIRSWHEVEANKFKFKWFPLQKGGDYRRWYGNHEYVILWEKNGEEIKEFDGSNIRNSKYYLKPGISWTRRTNTYPSFRFYGEDFILESTGPGVFAKEDDIPLLISLLNSKISIDYLKIFSPTLDYQSGDISRIPVAFPVDEIKLKIIKNGNNAIKLSIQDWDNSETSWDFQAHPLVQLAVGSGQLPEKRRSLKEAFQVWESQSETNFQELKRLEEENNRYWINAYGLQDELTPEVPDEQITIRRADLERDIKSLISYAVGCMMGRYGMCQ